MPQLRPAIVLTSILALCAGAIVLQKTRAADNPPPPQAASAGARSGEQPAAPSKSTGARPQVPEESATIPDDPTIAPDPRQSADNNVSFPNDI
jgi:hypothetical protein